MNEYFSHDYNARTDTKLVKLFMKHNLKGIGAYWCIIEMLYEEGGYLLLNEYDRIAFELRTDSEFIKSIIEDFNLFKKDEDKFWSDTAIDRLKQRAEKSEKARKSVQKRWDKYKRNTDVKETKNDSNTSKGKESKEKEIKVKEYSDEIINFTQSLYKYFPDKIINNLTPTQKQNWYKTIDELIRIDNYTTEQIETIVKTAREDKFWQKNFLSITKLRKTTDGVKYVITFEQLVPATPKDLSESGKYKYSKFYDEQLKISNYDKNYKQFIEALFGNNPLHIKLNNILQMEHQVLFEQFKNIHNFKIKNNILIVDILFQMENWKKLNSKTIVAETFMKFAEKTIK